MIYRTVYKIGAASGGDQTGVLYTLAAMAVILVIFSALRYWCGKTYSTRIFGVLGVVIGAFTLLAVAFVLTQRTERGMRIDGPIRTVEGVIENFQAMPFAGHDVDSFTINGIRFEYSDYVVTGGYNKTVSHGGGLAPGVVVRLTYVDSPNGARIITRAEVGKTESPAGKQ